MGSANLRLRSAQRHVVTVLWALYIWLTCCSAAVCSCCRILHVHNQSRRHVQQHISGVEGSVGISRCLESQHSTHTACYQPDHPSALLAAAAAPPDCQLLTRLQLLLFQDSHSACERHMCRCGFCGQHLQGHFRAAQPKSALQWHNQL